MDCNESRRGPYDVAGIHANNNAKSMNDKPLHSSWRNSQAGALVVALVLTTGCQSPFEVIDKSTTALLTETSQGLGADTVVPRLNWATGSKPDNFRDESLHDYTPPTANPAAAQLRFTADGDAESVVRRLDAYAPVSEDAISRGLNDTRVYAGAESRGDRLAGGAS